MKKEDWLIWFLLIAVAVIVVSLFFVWRDEQTAYVKVFEMAPKDVGIQSSKRLPISSEKLTRVYQYKIYYSIWSAKKGEDYLAEHPDDLVMLSRTVDGDYSIEIFTNQFFDDIKREFKRINFIQ